MKPPEIKASPLLVILQTFEIFLRSPFSNRITHRRNGNDIIRKCTNTPAWEGGGGGEAHDISEKLNFAKLEGRNFYGRYDFFGG